MFRNAFLSEFSFSEGENTDSVLKSHLLSNEKIVIPAATVSKTNLGNIINSNLSLLGDGAIVIAHGNDRNNLKEYIEKYPDVTWKTQVIEVFQHFDQNNMRVVYETKKTIKQFNTLMRKCASGEIPRFKKIFSNKNFCKEILCYKGLFDLNSYFSIVNKNINNTNELNVIYAHAKYYYNFFGSFSTDAGNTFSLENTTGFNYISSNNANTNEKLTGLNILISSALDLTDGIEDFNFLSNLDKNFIEKLSYQDILEIRENWLHERVIEKYERIVQECASSYLKMNEGKELEAITHIENAFEIRQMILDKVNLAVKSEIKAYKLHRLSRFFSDTAVSSISYLSGVNLLQSVRQFICSLTTEVAVYMNKEKPLKNLIEQKFSKIIMARDKAETAIGVKSPVSEYLRLVEKRLKS